MSIDRSQSSRDAEPVQRREPAQPKPLEKLEPPSAEQVDRFRAAMEQVREHKGKGQLEGQLANEDPREFMRADARATEAGLAEHEAAAEAARESVLSDVVDDKAQRRADDLGLSASSLPPADASALFQAQMAMRDGAMPTQAPPPVTNPQAFAELIERHVRQLAVDDAVARGDSGQMLLRMSDATLPGTDLLLSRNSNGDGWILRADVRSRSSFDAIREAAPQLAKRFAERNLGTLEIDPHFHG
jgi:hypothetical protein